MTDTPNPELLSTLVQKYGSPLYVYDAAKIISQIDRLKNAFKDIKVELRYACKALNNVNILKLVKSTGTGIDCVSIEEVQLALRVGFSPSEILFTPNGVAWEEIEEAVTWGVQLNIDNLPQLEHFGTVYGGKIPCCVRLNPHIMAGGNSQISVGHIDSKFGISIHQVPHIVRLAKSHHIKINGLHMHTGSDILDADVFLQGAELLFEAAKNFKDLTFMDFGSGFKVAYKTDDITTDIEDLGEKITERFKVFCKEYGRDLTLFFEPGKFVVSESGRLLVQANVIKQTTSTVFVGVNSGQNHLLRPMFYGSYHHITNISNPEGKEKLYSIVGYICETDTLGYDRKLNEVREGDILCIDNAGAYGITMSNNYNMRLRPAEVMLKDGKDYLIRRRETLDDLLAQQIEIVE